jgi:hypothetical protein
MASSPVFNIPSPPDSPDVGEIHQWTKDIYTLLNSILSGGNQQVFFTQDQINQMTGLEQAGKIFFNETTGKFMGGEVSGGALSKVTFTTS